MAADVSSTDSLGERYGMFGGCGMATGKAEVLLVISWPDMGRSEEAKLDNIKEGGEGPGKSDRMETVEVLK